MCPAATSGVALAALLNGIAHLRRGDSITRRAGVVLSGFYVGFAGLLIGGLI